MSADKTRDSMDKDSAAYQKRREQVRRAQRSHRERKENHIKTLEDQVHQLRSNEKRILEANEALAAEVADLRCRLVQNEPMNCHSLNSSNWTHAAPAITFSSSNTDTNSYSGCDLDSLPSWTLPSLDGSECSRSIKGSETFSMPELAAPASSMTANTCTSVSYRPSPPTSSLSDVNKNDMALEFVLTLEKPCFNRASSAVFDMGHPADFSVSAPPNVMSYHSFLEDDLFPFTSHSTRSEDTSKSLDKLLSLSSAFSLTTEVTPIQAWQYIVSHPKFAAIGAETLRRLVDEMLEHVRCYGFGAVIETTVFKMLFSNLVFSG
ncbi:hypothetical protein IQ07DRAFT_587488 [Pyrenochaeta sp. DS3sAY3a]|nr:hypothetical protein IQ07DRAFT_587488 [Pyrenochaeta sp. DS3sAY3a]